MAFFAYGGRDFGVRNQWGDWPAHLDGAVSPWTAPTSGRVCGCAWLADSLALIIRELTGGAGTRFVPLTILLIPEDRDWKRVGWNPALLLHALLSDPQRSSLLLDTPEQINSPALRRMLDDCVSVAASCRSLREDIRTVWPTLGLMNHVPGSAARDWGLTPLPTLEDLANTLETISPCFRPANGWLLGGDTDSANILGVSVCLKDIGSDRIRDNVLQPGQIQSLSSGGAILLDVWSRFQADTEVAAMVRERQDIPVRHWMDRWNQEPAEFAGRLQMFDTLTQADQLDDETYEDLLDLTDARAVAPQIRALVLHRFGGGSGTYPPNLTRLFLHWGEGGAVDLSPEIMLRFDPADIARHMIAAPGRLESIPAGMQMDTVLAAIELAAGEQVPGWFDAGVNLLPASDKRKKRQKLAEQAVERTASELQVWRSYLSNPPFRKDGLAQIITAIRSNLCDRWVRGEAWPEMVADYLFLAGDEGAEWLTRSKTPLSRRDGIVAEIRRLAAGAGEPVPVEGLAAPDGKLQGVAATWLQALAGPKAKGWRAPVSIESQPCVLRAALQDSLQSERRHRQIAHWLATTTAGAETRREVTEMLDAADRDPGPLLELLADRSVLELVCWLLHPSEQDQLLGTLKRLDANAFETLQQRAVAKPDPRGLLHRLLGGRESRRDPEPVAGPLETALRRQAKPGGEAGLPAGVDMKPPPPRRGSGSGSPVIAEGADLRQDQRRRAVRVGLRDENHRRIEGGADRRSSRPKRKG